MNHFFRATEDGQPLKWFGPVHIIILGFFLLGVYLLAVKKFGLKDKKHRHIFFNTTIGLMFIDQIILYIWQIKSGHFSWDMSLPLYHCRIAVWMLIIGVGFNIRKMKLIGIYWGSLGSVMALILTDLYNFKFPHYTNFQFFLVHILMGWLIIGLLSLPNIIINKKDHKFVLIFTNIYNMALFVFNILMSKSYPEVNYGYMKELPPMLPPFSSIFVHLIFMIVVFNIGIMLLGLIFKHVQKEMTMEKRINE